MSADSSTPDPYRSPTLPEGPYVAIAPNRRPGVLTTVCVIAMVLGALGMLNALLGTAGTIAGKQIQDTFRPASGAGMTPELQDAQKRLESDMLAVMQKHWWLLIISMAVRFVIALILLIGGIRSLSLSESGRWVLLLGCALALPYELLNAILQSVMMLENMTAMNRFAERLSEAMPTQGQADVAGKIVPVIMRVSMFAGLAIQSLISLVKIAFYSFSLYYLQKSVIRGLFGTTSNQNLKPQVIQAT